MIGRLASDEVFIGPVIMLPSGKYGDSIHSKSSNESIFDWDESIGEATQNKLKERLMSARRAKIDT